MMLYVVYDLVDSTFRRLISTSLAGYWLVSIYEYVRTVRPKRMLMRIKLPLH